MTKRFHSHWLVGLFLLSPLFIKAQAPEPTTPASNVSKTITSCDEVLTNWTSGNGSARIMIMKAGSPVDVLPQDNVSYTPSSVFGQGTNLGNGNYAVYKGSGTSATISGLQGGVTYHFAIFEYNTQSPSINYLTHTYPALNIPVPDPITLNAVVDSITCYNAKDGSIQLNLQGGTIPYAIMWGSGSNSTTQTNLGPGTYSVSVTDNVGCSAQGTFTLSQSDSLVIAANSEDVKCNGAATGSIDITLTGGSTPYQYQWSNGANTEDLSQLPASSYSLTATDKNGCTLTHNFQIDQPEAIVITPIVTNVTCSGDANGSIILSTSGGTGGFTYSWDDGSTANSRSNLEGGNYIVTVTDAAGCSITNTIEVSEPDPLTIALDISDVSCKGEQDGSVTADVKGGQTPYQYQWGTGATTNIIDQLTTGSYTLTVTDANSCQATDQAFVEVDPDKSGCLKYLIIYDAFTPNGDGKNDTWVIESLDEFPDNNLEIYNRWGKLVYQTANYQNDWKGENTNGELLPAGSYYYILYIHLLNDDVEKAGSVTFLR